MNILSLFDGMSCGQIALNRAGIKYDNYFASEINNNAINVTQSNYSKTIQIGDVTKVSAKDLPKIDLLIGGSPCQGFSLAGKQLNFDDPRSKLFFEFVRILKECRESNPDVFFLLENVVMKKEYEDVISDAMGCKPLQINSKIMSGQSRNRLYWTNIKLGYITPVNISLKSILDLGWWSNRDKSYCIDANYGKGSNLRRYLFCGSRQLVFADGFSIPSFVTKETANEFGSKNKGKWRILTPEECERLQTVPEGYTSSVSKVHRYHMLGNGWTVDVIAHIFKGLLN